MNILFLGTTGVHHTLVAANFFLSKPQTNDLKKLTFWDNREKNLSGYPIFIDYDNKGNKIYSLGCGWEVMMTQRSIQDLVKILNSSDKDMTVKPIFIKRERLLLALHKIGRFPLINRLIQDIINYLIKKELTSIKQQVEEFKGEVRFV
jgi:hypothetical protein